MKDLFEKLSLYKFIPFFVTLVVSCPIAFAKKVLDVYGEGIDALVQFVSRALRYLPRNKCGF